VGVSGGNNQNEIDGRQAYQPLGAGPAPRAGEVPALLPAAVKRHSDRVSDPKNWRQKLEANASSFLPATSLEILDYSRTSLGPGSSSHAHESQRIFLRCMFGIWLSARPNNQYSITLERSLPYRSSP